MNRNTYVAKLLMMLAIGLIVFAMIAIINLGLALFVMTIVVGGLGLLILITTFVGRANGKFNSPTEEVVVTDVPDQPKVERPPIVVEDELVVIFTRHCNSHQLQLSEDSPKDGVAVFETVRNHSHMGLLVEVQGVRSTSSDTVLILEGEPRNCIDHGNMIFVSLGNDEQARQLAEDTKETHRLIRYSQVSLKDLLSALERCGYEDIEAWELATA